MPKGRENVYTCTKCRRMLVTVDRDEGATPFMIGCRETGGTCTGTMESAWYPDKLNGIGGPRPSHFPAASHEWYRPTRDELTAYLRTIDPADHAATREHVSMGGLLLRPITTEPARA